MRKFIQICMWFLLSAGDLYVCMCVYVNVCRWFACTSVRQCRLLCGLLSLHYLQHQHATYVHHANAWRWRRLTVVRVFDAVSWYDHTCLTSFVVVGNIANALMLLLLDLTCLPHSPLAVSISHTFQDTVAVQLKAYTYICIYIYETLLSVVLHSKYSNFVQISSQLNAFRHLSKCI